MDALNRRDFCRASAACATASIASGADAGITASQTAASRTAGYDYRLPKIRQGSTLLFQGDSITDMKWGRNQKDRNHYLGHSYVFLIASRLHTDMPEAKLNFLNRGVSGNTVADLKTRWKKDALDLNPDVLSILVGVNDVGRAVRSGRNVDVDAFVMDYRSLLNRSRQVNPALRIVLLEPFVLPVTRVKDDWISWRSEIDALRPLVSDLAEEFGAILLKTQSIFDAATQRAEPSHWIWDGVHPLPQGHELIARNWIESVAKAWK